MRTVLAAATSGLLLLALPLGLHAQGGGTPTVTLEIFGGGAQFGRFLEQRAGGGERELQAEGAPAFGGSVGLSRGGGTSVRVAFTAAPTTLIFRDDTGNGSTNLDVDDVADLSAYLVSVEVLRYLADERRWVAPYATAGVSGGVWSLGDEGSAVTGEEESLWRFGGVGGLGLRLRASPALSLRLELNNFGLRNPFDGRDAFRVTSGDTREEPETVRVSRLTLGLSYSLGQ